jgi:hypothetical protein
MADEVLRIDMVTTGKVMVSTKLMPEHLKENTSDKMRQENILSFRNNGKLSLAWRIDVWLHSVLSSFHMEKKQGNRNYPLQTIQQVT